jgi:uncharacterized protein (TIGR02231 family)
MMKNIRHLFFCWIAVVVLTPAWCAAAVTDVTLFPNSARVSETVGALPACDGGRCQAVITLPPQSDPDSLVVAIPGAGGAKIDDVQIKPIPYQDEARIAELRKQLTAAEDQKKDIRARLQAIDAQIQFWQAQTKAKTKTIADSYKTAEAIGKNILKANQEKFAAEAQLEKIEKNIKKLQDELNQAAGKKETAWEATVTLSGRISKDIPLAYTYTLAGCGWLPLYRVEALPAASSVSFSWDAEIWQSSGKDWKQVSVNLATLQPSAGAAPPIMPDWIIQPQILYKIPRSKAILKAPLQEEAAIADEEPFAAPEETRHTTYSVWSLGKINLAAGERQRLKIKDESWPADFLFLARPALDSQAFVRAVVKLNQPAEIPSGEALFLIDGAILGKREFSFAGMEQEIYFGNSPLISVTSTTLANQSGAKTFLQDKQTKSWQWLIEAKNSGHAAVKVRIEEPRPQARDQRIKLTFKQNPEPAEKDHAKFVWLVDVPAGQKKTIQNTIEMEAPAEMNLDFGWR